jgi:hypothetical protein
MPFLNQVSSCAARRGFTVSSTRSTPRLPSLTPPTAAAATASEQMIGLESAAAQAALRSRLAVGRKQVERQRSQHRNGRVLTLQRQVDEISDADRRIMVLSLVEEAARYNKRHMAATAIVSPASPAADCSGAEFNKRWLSLKLDVCHTDMEDAVEALSHMSLFLPGHAEGVASSADAFTPRMSLTDAMNPHLARAMARRSAEVRNARLRACSPS